MRNIVLGCIGLLTLCSTLMAKEKGMNEFKASGFVQNWLIVGPFPSEKLKEAGDGGVSMSGFGQDFLKELGGEGKAEISLETKIKRPDGSLAGIKASKAAMNDNKWIDGSVGYRANQSQLNYAFAWIESDKEQDAYFYFDSEGSPKVWLNGELIIQNWRESHILKPRDYGVKIKLNKGRNRLLVKLDSKQVWWLARAELLTAKDYVEQLPKAVKALKASSLDGSQLTLQTQPLTFEKEISVSYVIKDMADQQLAAGNGKAGEPIGHDLAIGKSRIVKVYATATTSDGKQIKSNMLAHVGSVKEGVKDLADRLEAAKAKAMQVKPWAKAYEGIFAWAERYLNSGAKSLDKKQLQNLLFLYALIEEVEAERNFFKLAAKLDMSIPVWVTVKTAAGNTHPLNFTFTLPEAMVEKRDATPVAISLSGGSHRYHEVGAVVEAFNVEIDSVDVDVPERLKSTYMNIRPANLDGRWNAELLDLMLDYIQSILPVDQTRIYLAGGSHGAYGTHNWLARSGERFAAAVLRAGSGDPEKIGKMVQTPTWFIIGEKDRALVRTMKTIINLKEAGAKVRVNVVAGRGHGLGNSYDKAAVAKWIDKQVLMP